MFSGGRPGRSYLRTSGTGLAAGTQVAALETALGPLCIELLSDDAPLHVANFLYYLNNGLLVDTFFHRHVAGFVLQGASFTLGQNGYHYVFLNRHVTDGISSRGAPALETYAQDEDLQDTLQHVPLDAELL